jgi:hypothetical protein
VTRYFFDIRDGQDLLLDEEGMEFPDLEAAFREAARSLADISSKGSRNVGAGMAVVVRDDNGTVVLDTALSWPSRLQ